jgi:hypothetical protein
MVLASRFIPIGKGEVASKIPHVFTVSSMRMRKKTCPPRESVRWAVLGVGYLASPGLLDGLQDQVSMFLLFLLYMFSFSVISCLNSNLVFHLFSRILNFVTSYKI